MAEEQGGMGELRGRRALVVGGSGGLGRATALALAARGADLLVHGGSSRDRLDATVAACGRARAALHGASAAEGAVEGLLLPIARPEDLLGLLPTLGTFDILVCAFGPFHQAPLAATAPEAWSRLCLLNLALPGALASALLPAMLEKGWGRMVFFGGTRTDAIRDYGTNAAYAAAKTGLGVLVKSLAAEGGGRGLGAYLLCPGFADTEYLDEATRSRLKARAPGGRLIPSQEIGELAASLVAAGSTLASGALISLDGGLRL